MEQTGARGYKRKPKYILLKEIDRCTSLSQLFALIQHEGIEIQMHAQSGASNLTPRKLTVTELAKEQLPLERLKTEVKKAVWNRYDAAPQTAEDTELVKKIRQTKTLNELFALIKKENIIIQMHAQTGASNLTPRKLEPAAITDTNDAPFERLKAEVIKSVSNRRG